LTIRIGRKKKANLVASIQHRTLRAKITPMNTPARFFVAGFLTVVLSGVARTQESQKPAALPDSPTPKQQHPDHNQGQNPFSTPIGIIARRSYVYPELATSPGPLTSKQKFQLFLSKSSAPPQLLSSLAGASISQARNTLPGYGQEWAGFGDRFGSSLATGASSHFFGTFLLPAMLHDDPRFFVTYRGRWYVRVGHALRREVVTRTDNGGERFNLPGTLGPLMAEGLANVYLPQSERTAGKTFQRFGIRIGFGTANNLVKEYWPTIVRSLRIDKVAPNLRPDPAPPRERSNI